MTQLSFAASPFTGSKFLANVTPSEVPAFLSDRSYIEPHFRAQGVGTKHLGKTSYSVGTRNSSGTIRRLAEGDKDENGNEAGRADEGGDLQLANDSDYQLWYNKALIW